MSALVLTFGPFSAYAWHRHHTDDTNSQEPQTEESSDESASAAAGQNHSFPIIQKDESTDSQSKSDDDSSSSKEKTTESDNSVAPTAGPESAQESRAVPPRASKTLMLQGKAEVQEERSKRLEAYHAAQTYKQGVAALDRNQWRVAADCFKRAGDGLKASIGDGQFLAQARYAEAQARRLLGQTQQATQLYKIAADLFQKYDPFSPYMKGAMDQLKKLSPGLAGQVSSTNANLRALLEATGIKDVDRNVILRGTVTDADGKVHLLSEKGTMDIPEGTVKDVLLKALLEMNCMETAELGSNSYTGPGKFMPLMANKKTVALPATSDFNAPTIRVKLNGRYYSVSVDLPDLAGEKRTVFLFTDGQCILAVDAASYDVWKLKANLEKRVPEFNWQKYTHIKKKSYVK